MRKGPRLPVVFNELTNTFPLLDYGITRQQTLERALPTTAATAKLETEAYQRNTVRKVLHIELGKPYNRQLNKLYQQVERGRD